MKSMVVISCVLLIGCGQRNGNEATDAKSGFGETDIKSSWVELNEKDGKWVIMNWCAAENLHLDWQQDTLTIVWGQDASRDKITRIAFSGKTFTLEGTSTFGDASIHTYRVEPIDSLEGVARWWLDNRGEPRILAKASLKDKYEVVQEDCDGMFDGPTPEEPVPADSTTK